MSFDSFDSFQPKMISFNNPPASADELASQSARHPQLVCTWSAHAPQSGSSFPRNRLKATATANAAGELFLFGSDLASIYDDDIYVFSTRDFSTTLLQTSGEVHPHWEDRGHGVALIGTTLFICGVDDNNCYAYFLNLESRKWSRVVVNDPEPGYCFYPTTNVVGSKIFIFGGEDGAMDPMNDMWLLDLDCLKSQPVWDSELYEPTPGSKKPLPRSNHASVTTGNHIIIFGGIGRHFFNDTWSFDITTRKWTELQCTGTIPSPRSDHAAVLVDGIMYVFGGRTAGGTYSGDLIALRLSTHQWFRFHSVGQSPPGRWHHSLASDGTRIFVLGGNLIDPQLRDIPRIHVFDTKLVDMQMRLWDMQAKLDELLLSRDQQIGQYERELASVHAKLEATVTESELEAVRLRLADAEKGWTSLDELVVFHDQQVGQYEEELASVRAKLEANESELEAVRLRLADAEEDWTSLDELVVSHDQQVGQYEKELTDMRAKLEAKESELEAVCSRLTDAEKGWTSLDRLVVSHDQQVGQHEKELASVRAKLEATVTESELEAVRLRLADTEKGWTSLDKLVVSHDQQVGQYEKELTDMHAKLEAKESELEAVRSRLTDAEKGWTSLDKLVVSHDQQVGQLEKELASMRAKLEANESELEVVRLRLTDADSERGWTKSNVEADTLRARNAAGSANKDEDQIICGLMERMQAIEDEMASRRSEKMIIDRNEG